jgi:hypothetical protein
METIMIPDNGSTVLYETPIILRGRVSADKEKAIQLSQIISRNIKAENSGRAARRPSFHVSPITRLVKSRRRVKASAKVLEGAADGFIYGL